MTLNAAQSLLFVADDQSDTVEIIDTARNAIVASIPVIAPLLPARLSKQGYKGANPNSVALSPDERAVRDGWQPELHLGYRTERKLRQRPGGGSHSDRLVPQLGKLQRRWRHGVRDQREVADGRQSHLVLWRLRAAGRADLFFGEYVQPPVDQGRLQTFPHPSLGQLGTLTQQVIANNRFAYTESDHDKAVMAAVREGVQHVIFILKENRSYDQILGDLPSATAIPAWFCSDRRSRRISTTWR